VTLPALVEELAGAIFEISRIPASAACTSI
jgi:hypothetical protein